MLTVNLEKSDLITLVKGTEVPYKLIDDKRLLAHGRYSGSYDRWDWNYSACDDMEEHEIWDLYCFIKQNQ